MKENTKIKKKKSKPNTKTNSKEKILVGRYQLGWRMVNLFINTQATGGQCNLVRNKEEAFIQVGVYEEKYYPNCLSILYHETLELTMRDHGVCFKPSNSFEESASDCVHFYFNHNQFTEIASKASYFMHCCLNDFINKLKELKLIDFPQ